MQLVGQQLILECNVTITGCITSSLRADIVWSRNNVGLKRTENANVSYANNITVIYVDEYIISQVSTNEDGIIYQCKMVINQTLPLIAVGTTILNITGKYISFT